jgi:hypothetical protein
METKIEPDEPVQKVIPPCDTCAVLPGSTYCESTRKLPWGAREVKPVESV